jgi:hypothetical protein
VKPVILVILLFLASNAEGQDLPKFMGRQVTVTVPDVDDNRGLFPKGLASVCIEGPPLRQCYTAPERYGRAPTAELVQVQKGMPALLFSAASGGVSGWGIHFALLRPGKGKDLQDLFLSDTSLSNQSQHRFWNDPAVSAAPIFVTADFVWGGDESHYSPHRYMVSAYVLEQSTLLEDPKYFLEDRYMTARAYDLDAKADVLTSEKLEIFSRLRRLAANLRTRTPH